MKKYLKDLGPKEIIENIKKGLSIENDNIADKYFMIDNIICHLDHYGNLYINSSLPFAKHEWYFKIEEPFEIKETGLYKTRDGRKAFVSYVKTDELYPPTGMIEGSREKYSWTKEGYDIEYGAHNTDIVSKWEE